MAAVSDVWRVFQVKVLALGQFVNERQEAPAVPKAATLEVTLEQTQNCCEGASGPGRALRLSPESRSRPSSQAY